MDTPLTIVDELLREFGRTQATIEAKLVDLETIIKDSIAPTHKAIRQRDGYRERLYQVEQAIEAFHNSGKLYDDTSKTP